MYFLCLFCILFVANTHLGTVHREAHGGVIVLHFRYIYEYVRFFGRSIIDKTTKINARFAWDFALINSPERKVSEYPADTFHFRKTRQTWALLLRLTLNTTK